MEKFVKGDIVITPFPFSDLSSSKNRPSVVAATLRGDDLILCQISSQQRNDEHALPLSEDDFQVGKLDTDSFIRPSRLFTADSSLVHYKAGKLREAKIQQIQNKLIEIFSA